MKKIFAVLLALVLVGSLTACKPAGDSGADGGQWDGKSAMEIMQAVADKADAQIMAEVVDGKELYRSALTLGELEFEEIALYMPMISSQRFEAAVIRVKDGTNVAKYVSDLEKRAANAEWVCAAPPDYVKVVAAGDCVLYLAITSDFADEEAMVEAFRGQEK